jgi:hypothetical protein
MRPPTYRPFDVPGLPAPSARNAALGRMQLAIVKGKHEVEVSQAEWTAERASARIAELRDVLRHTRSADIREAVRRAIADIEQQRPSQSSQQSPRSLPARTATRLSASEATR